MKRWRRLGRKPRWCWSCPVSSLNAWARRASVRASACSPIFRPTTSIGTARWKPTLPPSARSTATKALMACWYLTGPTMAALSMPRSGKMDGRLADTRFGLVRGRTGRGRAVAIRSPMCGRLRRGSNATTTPSPGSICVGILERPRHWRANRFSPPARCACLAHTISTMRCLPLRLPALLAATARRSERPCGTSPGLSIGLSWCANWRRCATSTTPRRPTRWRRWPASRQLRRRLF